MRCCEGCDCGFAEVADMDGELVDLCCIDLVVPRVGTNQWGPVLESQTRPVCDRKISSIFVKSLVQPGRRTTFSAPCLRARRRSGAVHLCSSFSLWLGTNGDKESIGGSWPIDWVSPLLSCFERTARRNDYECTLEFTWNFP